MSYVIKNDLIEQAKQVVSPNFNQRPDHKVINAIVIHCISLPPENSNTQAVEQFFTNQLDFSTHPYFQTISHLKVSAHLLISKAGEITQFVPFNLRAWHAGVSNLYGETDCNDFSIGIELEGRDDATFTPIQYQQLVACVKAMLITYPHISRERIVGHSDIAPGRKTDPGPRFDWGLFDKLLALKS